MMEVTKLISDYCFTEITDISTPDELMDVNAFSPCISGGMSPKD